MKKYACIMILLLCCGMVSAQTKQPGSHHLRRELEGGTDGQGFVSQYLFYTYSRSEEMLGFSALIRYSQQGEDRKRHEVAGGPHFQFERGSIDVYVGKTSDDYAMLAIAGFVRLPEDYTLFVISDSKFSATRSRLQPRTWYRKVILGRRVHIRWEDLHIENIGTAFGRIGGEIRLRPASRYELSINPFWDYWNTKLGIQGGVRMNIL